MMMMIGELNRPHPTVHIPPYHLLHHDDPTATNILSPYSYSSDDDSSPDSSSFFFPFDSFCGDDFRMYEFKVRKCVRGRSHDWTECPFAHPGEKARRRDPRKYHYSGVSCPEFRRGSCRKGDACEFAHGVFECWLHPSRYRTQPCKDGPLCKRKICFFAHSPDQLRVVGNGSAVHDLDPIMVGPFGESVFVNSGTRSVSPTSESPPMSPCRGGMCDLVSGMRGLQVGQLSLSPRAWSFGQGSGFGPKGPSSGIGPGSSPRSPAGTGGARGERFCSSVPCTPTRVRARCGLGLGEYSWDAAVAAACEEEPVMERVESGRDLRARIYEKLSRQNSLARAESVAAAQPDLGWVSELIK